MTSITSITIHTTDPALIEVLGRTDDEERGPVPPIEFLGRKFIVGSFSQDGYGCEADLVEIPL